MAFSGASLQVKGGVFMTQTAAVLIGENSALVLTGASRTRPRRTAQVGGTRSERWLAAVNLAVAQFLGRLIDEELITSNMDPRRVASFLVTYASEQGRCIQEIDDEVFPELRGAKPVVLDHAQHINVLGSVRVDFRVPAIGNLAVHDRDSSRQFRIVISDDRTKRVNQLLDFVRKYRR